MGVLPPVFARMAADCMVVVVVVMHANWALCLVVVAIDATIERPRVAHAGPRHGWAVTSLGGVGGGRGGACGRVVGVVAGVEELGVCPPVIVGVLVRYIAECFAPPVPSCQ